MRSGHFVGRVLDVCAFGERGQINEEFRLAGLETSFSLVVIFRCRMRYVFTVFGFGFGNVFLDNLTSNRGNRYTDGTVPNQWV